MDYPLQKILKFVLLTSITLLSGCTLVTPQKELKSQDYYYPYLTKSQISSLSAYNALGVFPPAVIVPTYEQKTLTGQLNAENTYPNDSDFAIHQINKFLANNARQTLGCGPLVAGTILNIPPGIYRTPESDISVNVNLKLKLNNSIASLCVPAALSPKVRFPETSHYWHLIFSQQKAFA